MTVLQVFNAVLTELNKSKAPSLLLEDFVYFLNKEVIKYINKAYNLDEINQQKQDDLRVLQSTAILTPTTSSVYSSSNLLKNTKEVYLPDDYLHIRNCTIEYKVLSNFDCNKENDYIQYGARRLSGDKWSQVINNYYFKPSYKNPYFILSNVENSINYPTTDNMVNISNLPVEKVSGNRYGNKTKVRMEIRYGKNSKLEISNVYIDYIRSPKYINLTQEEIDDITDNSEVLEFQDYVINEIINGLVESIMENNSNQRIQSHIPINTTIPTNTK